MLDINGYNDVHGWDMGEPRYLGDGPSRPTGPDYFKTPPTTDLSKKHEKETAQRTGGRRVPGSGNQLGRPGDVTGSEDLQELKATQKTDTRINLQWLRDVAYQAMTQGKEPIVNMRFAKLAPPCPTDWVLIPADVYNELKKRAGLNE
jgi:hypothetical protein